MPRDCDSNPNSCRDVSKIKFHAWRNDEIFGVATCKLLNRRSRANLPPSALDPKPPSLPQPIELTSTLLPERPKWCTIAACSPRTKSLPIHHSAVEPKWFTVDLLMAMSRQIWWPHTISKFSIGFCNWGHFYGGPPPNGVLDFSVTNFGLFYGIHVFKRLLKMIGNFGYQELEVAISNRHIWYFLQWT